MSEIQTIFAVIDPTTRNQRALNRAALGAKSTGARIHAYLCLSFSVEGKHFHDYIESELSRYETWVNALVEPIRADGIEIEVEIEQHDDWRSVLGPAATRAKSDLIIKNAHYLSGSKTPSLSTADWSLFQSAPCPVMIAKSERSSGSGNVLVAIKPVRTGDNERVIDETLSLARDAVASYTAGTLHVVSAYEGSDHELDAESLAKRTGIDLDHVHAVTDRIDAAIETCAADIDAELIVIGVEKSPRLSGVLFGSTTDWLLNHVERDVMMAIPQHE